MENNSYQGRLVAIINIIREYGHRILEGLTKEELLWRPEGTKARTIQSYFRHIINAEIYWLKKLDDEKFFFMQKDTSFNDLLSVYGQIEHYLIQLIEKISEDDLVPKKPVFKGKEQQQKGNLTWMVERTSLHAIHHFGQISHIRYCLENPPPDSPPTWGQVIDSLVFLKV
ncbi:MAG: DinB family protein [Candidatus Hodarchaeales archaeon]|jgi:uncharacterized damage-inducible protein DinB